jgi:prepilin-type N-terminal cleavage/methylation domain-containing protein
MNPTKHRHGFTLVELLVTITIVVALAGILFALSKKSIDRAHQAVCITHLGYVGQAIQAYASENGNRLPGPLYNGQSAIVGPPRNIATFIAEYLEAPGQPVNGKIVIASFGCPASKKKINSKTPEDAICYQIGSNLKLVNGRTVNPWTYPKPWGTPQPEPPSRLDEFDPVSAGQTMALIEQDAQLSNAWGSNSGPAAPPHGNQRTTLYFDWSVRTIPVPDR